MSRFTPEQQALINALRKTGVSFASDWNTQALLQFVCPKYISPAFSLSGLCRLTHDDALDFTGSLFYKPYYTMCEYKEQNLKDYGLESADQYWCLDPCISMFYTFNLNSDLIQTNNKKELFEFLDHNVSERIKINALPAGLIDTIINTLHPLASLEPTVLNSSSAFLFLKDNKQMLIIKSVAERKVAFRVENVSMTTLEYLAELQCRTN